MLKSYLLVSQNMTIGGDKVFKVVVQLKSDHYSGPYMNMTGVFIREHLDTDMYREKIT